MNRKKRLQRLVNRKSFPFILLFFLAFGWHFVMHMYSSDDEIMRALTYDSLFSFMLERYLTWSTRIFTDTIFMILLRLPSIIWRVLDSALYACFAAAVSYLADDGNKPVVRWLTVCGFCIYPFVDMISAGWIVTTCVYLWSCAFLFFAAAAAKKMYLSESNRLPVRWWFLTVIASLMAGSMEQACCSLIAVSALFGGYSLYKKRFSSLYAVEFCIGLIMLGMHLLSPALPIRDVAEARGWFADFAEVTFLHRLEMGFSATMYHYLMEPSLLFLLFSGFLFARLLQKKESPFFLLTAAIPLLTALIYGFGMGYDVFTDLFPQLAAIRDALGFYGTDPHWGDWDTFLPLLLLVVNAICICTALYRAFDSFESRWTAIFSLCVSTAVRMALGFSPTIWASGYRTFIILQFCFVFLICRLCSVMEKSDSRFTRYALPAVALIAAAQYITTLLTCNAIGI